MHQQVSLHAVVGLFTRVSRSLFLQSRRIEECFEAGAPPVAKKKNARTCIHTGVSHVTVPAHQKKISPLPPSLFYSFFFDLIPSPSSPSSLSYAEQFEYFCFRDFCLCFIFCLHREGATRLLFHYPSFSRYILVRLSFSYALTHSSKKKKEWRSVE